MRVIPKLILAVLILMFCGCSSELGDGPYDPDTPLDKQAKASLAGVVSLEWAGDVTQVEVLVDGKTDHPAADGNYEIEGILPKNQEILYRLEGYHDLVEHLLFDPGVKFGLNVELRVERGSLSGNVKLQDQTNHSGVTVLLSAGGTGDRAPEDFQVGAVSGSSGDYVFADVPVGDYQLTADKAHYLLEDEINVTIRSGAVTTADPLQMLPVTGLVEILGGPDYQSSLYTRTQMVRLVILGFNAGQMKFSEDDAMEDAEWVTYDTHADFTLSDGDGEKTVYVLLRGLNDVESRRLQASITLDTIPPTGTVSIRVADPENQCIDNTCYTNSESVFVFVDPDDTEEDPAQLKMILSLDDDFNEAPQMFTPLANLLLANLTTAQSVHVLFIDPAGNATPAQSENQVVLDLTPPTLPAITTDPSGYTSQREVTVNRLAPSDDDNPLLRYEYQIERVSSSWHTGWLPVEDLNQTQITHPELMLECTQASCLNLVKLRAVDIAGNVGDAAVIQLVLDQLAPPTPVASVSQITEQIGREERLVINSDVATVWVSLDSSDDPNFIQYKISTNQGTDWHDTGVGMGGIQIPVMLTQNGTNHVWVCGEDLAGNRSCSPTVDQLSKVTFVEDSTPPTAPVIYPAEGEVNADRILMLISTPSTDEIELDRYEVSINGDPFVDPFEDEINIKDFFPVHLRQDRVNSIQIRAVDVAGNRSGTFFASIVENSTPYVRDELEITGTWSRSVGNLKVDNVRSRGVENTQITATLYGRSGGHEEQGMVVVDLRDHDVTWVHDVLASGMDLKAGRTIMDLSLWNVCSQEDYIDSTVNPLADVLCECFLGLVDPQDCDQSLDLVQHQLNYDASTLVLADVANGRIAFNWVEVDGDDIPWKRPLMSRNSDSRTFSYDGHRLAWLNSPGGDKCEVRVAELSDVCDPFDGGCPWTQIFHYVSPLENNETLLDCEPVAMGGNLVAWGQRTRTGDGDMRVGIWMAKLDDPVEVGLVSRDALRFSRENAEMLFDCSMDPRTHRPNCKNLFWVDNASMTPWLYAFNLGLLDTGITLNPATDLVEQNLHDRIRHGVMELRKLSAANGRVVWIDGLTGSQDIFFSDLAECYRLENAGPGGQDCTGHFRVLTQSVFRDDEPSLWDDLVTFWRAVEGGLQLRMMDIGSNPWLIPRAGAHAFPMIAGEKLLSIWGDESDPDRPNALAVIDPIENTSTELWRFETLIMPFGFRWTENETAAAFIQLMPDGNVGAMYCDTGMNCDTDKVDLGQAQLPPIPGECFVMGMRGDAQRTCWTQMCQDDHMALLDCDMDKSAGTVKCSDGDFRFLLHLRPPVRLCNLNIDGKWAIMSLYDDDNHDTAIYLLDLDELDGATLPVTVSDAGGLAGTPGFKAELHSFNGNQRCENFDQLADIDAESMRAAIVVHNREPAQCGDPVTYQPIDNPDTYYIDEGCDQPPCCGDLPCECVPVDGVSQWRDYVRILAFDIDIAPVIPTAEVIAVDGEFSHSDPHHVTILDKWLVWQARFGNQDDLMLANLDTGAKRRFTYHVSDQTRPQLGRFADGIRLFWSDTRLGVIQTFNTLIEGNE